MESQQNEKQPPRWLARYNREEHKLDLCNYGLKCSLYQIDS